MGPAQSKTKTSIITKTAIEAVTNNIMNCANNTVVSQSFTISGNYNVVNNARQVQHTVLSVLCAQDLENVESIQQEVSNALKQSAEAHVVAVLGALGSTEAEVDATIENEVKQKFTKNNIMDIINDTNAEQKFVISGNNNIVGNFSQDQTTNLLISNVQKALNDMKVVQTLENAVEQSAKLEQSDPITSALDSVGGTVGGVADTAANAATSIVDTAGSTLAKLWMVIGFVIVSFMVVIWLIFNSITEIGSDTIIQEVRPVPKAVSVPTAVPMEATSVMPNVSASDPSLNRTL